MSTSGNHERAPDPAGHERTAARARAVDLEALFDVLLAELVASEAAALRFLRRLERKAVSARLVEAIGCARADTEFHLRRFERLLAQRKRVPRRRFPGIVDTIVRTARLDLRKIHRSQIGDVLLTTVLQKIAHHGIAVVGSLAAWAEAMAQEQPARMFAEALRDKKLADRYLTEIGGGIVLHSLFDLDAEHRAESGDSAPKGQVHDGDG